MDNRATRRAKLSAFKKELKGAKFDEFTDITTPEARQKLGKLTRMGDFKSFHRNSIYSVQIYQRGECQLLGIRRHDQKASCPWVHRQKIKNLFLGEEACAVEFMPPVKEEVDQANMYWIIGGDPVMALYETYGGLS